MFFETVQTWKTIGGQEVAIHTQVRVAPWARPIGQLGIDAFAVHHQRAHQANVLPLEFAQQLRGNAIRCLRLHRCTIMRAMLRAELDVQQTQKVPHLGGGAHGGLAPATAQTLLNRHRRWNTIDRIHLGPTCGLHDGARIGVEAF